ncbi:unnamed protein product [Meganyctiphanes norvegica]|uniref:Uncharacterized protein n=1 Tax=Meganyctiphanes norvegica TaxID=48144 RepID=A0AAV2PN80_MEGNR
MKLSHIIKWIISFSLVCFNYVVNVSSLIVTTVVKPNQAPEFYITPTGYNPNTAKTPNYSPFLSIEGRFCETRQGGQCCPDRTDECSVPVLGTLCYCDQFCDRAPNKKVPYANPDCCPDFYSVCRGGVGPSRYTRRTTTTTTPRPRQAIPPDNLSAGWSPCSTTCGMGLEERVAVASNGTSFRQTRPCLLSRCETLFNIKPPIPEGCGGLFAKSGGSLSYPVDRNANYNNNANCRWLIATSPKTVIQLNVTNFHTQKNHDYLTIQEHNAASFTANISGVMDGIVTTSSNIVTLVFTSDETITYSGFVIHWKETDVPIPTIKPATSIDVKVWICKDSWSGQACIQDGSALVCNCKDAQDRGWCETDKYDTQYKCQATCDPLCEQQPNT